MINTREDLDALQGTAEYDAFMHLLRSSLWRLERDDAAKTWVAVEDNSVIERFGFTRADFPDAQPPELPEYVAPTPEQIRRALEAALDAYIDSVAQAKGYDSRITAALRAGYPNPWQAEGIAFGTWMDSCYSTALTIMTEVQAGTRPIPTKDELIAAMPTMVWPT